MRAWEERESVKFVDSFHLNVPEHYWGFVLFRTVYTADSQARWQEAIAKLKTLTTVLFQHELDKDPSLDSEPCDIVADTFQLILQNDKEHLDGSSEQVVRSRFHTWLRQHEDDEDVPFNTRTSACLMIDEDSLESILASPEATPENFNELIEDDSAWVKVVAEEWSEELSQ
ncbi:Hypothetical protein D9617_7g031770 [Elsinoe fawcettii]|nr:Hypothetical protein D9617_7g031770 [Elsinoe fawcettii]